jgi:patatin-like phospholipase/acyl hydrolase
MNYTPPRRSDGTIQHLRLKQPWPQGRPFRILSIDGGGIRGVFPAAVLAELETRFLGGASITNHFDMIAGTSTGGIIALALAHGMTARQALNIYLERGERIFPATTGLRKMSRVLRWVFKPKHDQAALKEELLRIFGDKVLDDAVIRLVIPSFEGRHGEPFLNKTPHHPDYQKDRHKKFAHVALHTTAAPSYYPGVEDDGYVMIDGGIWANNPVMNALVDALACFDIAREDVRILSLGTGESTFTVDERATAASRTGRSCVPSMRPRAPNRAMPSAKRICWWARTTSHGSMCRKAIRRSRWMMCSARSESCRWWHAVWSKAPGTRSSGCSSTALSRSLRAAR